MLSLNDKRFIMCLSDGIPITSYRAKSCEMVVAPPVVVYFHGGGNTVGSRKTHANVCKILSRLIFINFICSEYVPVSFQSYVYSLTHISLASLLWDIGK